MMTPAMKHDHCLCAMLVFPVNVDHTCLPVVALLIKNTSMKYPDNPVGIY